MEQKITWYRRIHETAYEVIRCPACGKKLDEYCEHDIFSEVMARVDANGVPFDEIS